MLLQEVTATGCTCRISMLLSNTTPIAGRQSRHASCMSGGLGSRCALNCTRWRAFSRPADTIGRGWRRSVVRVEARLPFEVLPFEVVRPPKTPGSYELRLYRPRFVVEMPYTNRQDAYEAFDRYLTGSNQDGYGLDAPPPVVMRHDQKSGTKVMQMLAVKLGSAVDNETLLQQPPLPNDSRLSLNIAGGEVVAVLQFPGQATKQASESAYSRLKEQLSKDGTVLAAEEAEGLYRVVQYSPVHSLQAKTNELWLAVQLD